VCFPGLRAGWLAGVSFVGTAERTGMATAELQPLFAFLGRPARGPATHHWGYFAYAWSGRFGPAVAPPELEVLVPGDIDAPGVDTELIIRKHGIPDAHPPEAMAAAIRLGTTVTERDLSGRRDFRSVPTVTIDGEHARDFDDAISIEKLPSGHFWLGVHIADVSHYVPEGSLLDREAYDRSTSVYFPERAVHMFPAELATGLCSLKPHVDRLVQSCLMEVDRWGQVVRDNNIPAQ